MRSAPRTHSNTDVAHIRFGQILERFHRERQQGTLHVFLLGYRIQRYLIPYTNLAVLFAR